MRGAAMNDWMMGEHLAEFDARRGGAVQRRFAAICGEAERCGARPGPFDKDELTAFLKVALFARLSRRSSSPDFTARRAAWRSARSKATSTARCPLRAISRPGKSSR